MKILLLLTFGISFLLLSQEANTNRIELPTPVIGWDSLTTLIKYPEISRRSYNQGGFIVRLKIDTSGNAKAMNIFELSVHSIQVDSAYNITLPIYRYLKDVKWHPAIQFNKRVEYTISIPIIFVFNGDHQVKPIIKSSPWFDSDKR